MLWAMYNLPSAQFQFTTQCNGSYGKRQRENRLSWVNRRIRYVVGFVASVISAARRVVLAKFALWEGTASI
ncbi:MAG TPA: hypothetical protein VM260_20350, partial [Pirellula sp.]|nr:hypothetical protein [Pirellula sp.]